MLFKWEIEICDEAPLDIILRAQTFPEFFLIILNDIFMVTKERKNYINLLQLFMNYFMFFSSIIL